MLPMTSWRVHLGPVISVLGLIGGPCPRACEGEEVAAQYGLAAAAVAVAAAAATAIVPGLEHNPCHRQFLLS